MLKKNHTAEKIKIKINETWTDFKKWTLKYIIRLFNKLNWKSIKLELLDGY